MPIGPAWNGTAFSGAKLAIISDRRVVALRRDDRGDIPWPGMWDLPGGGREGDETPWQTAARETREETGLEVDFGRVVRRRCYRPLRPSWFFVAHWRGLRDTDLTLGDEGQAVLLMPVAEFLARGDAIPHLRMRLEAYCR